MSTPSDFRKNNTLLIGSAQSATQTSVRRLLLVPFVSSVLFASGCQSLESTRLVDWTEKGGVESVEERGESRLFLEVAVPEPSCVQRDRIRRDAWLKADYESDKKRPFTAFEIPTEYSLTSEDFQTSGTQTGHTGPHILFQLRQREFVTVQKSHEVVTRGAFSSQTKSKVENLNVWSYWQWEPERKTVGHHEVIVRIPELAKSPGFFSEFSGLLDDQGQFRFSLAPLLEAGARQGRYPLLTLEVDCPKKDLSILVKIRAEVLFQFLQQTSQAVESDPQNDPQRAG